MVEDNIKKLIKKIFNWLSFKKSQGLGLLVREINAKTSFHIDMSAGLKTTLISVFLFLESIYFYQFLVLFEILKT